MSVNKSHRIFIVAGEPSGDLIGAYLVEALHARCSDVCLQGVGGRAMRQAGVDILLDSESLAVIGFVEIIAKISLLRHAMKTIVRSLRLNPPDLLILVDYPGFNLRLAAKAKALGIKVMYYVSPQIWAWHYSRIKKIKKNVDLMAVLFPFERDIYVKEKVPVKFTGHPVIEKAIPHLSKAEVRQQFRLSAERPVIALLPGSRQREIQSLLGDMIGASKLIRQQIPEVQFVLPLAPDLSLETIRQFDLNEIKVLERNTYNVLQLCDAAVVASGTATLEVAVLGVPQVIIYRVSRLTYRLAKWLANVNYFGLCNLVAEKPVALELVQDQVTPANISGEVIRLINDAAYRDQIQQKLTQLRQRLLTEGASERAADAAMGLILADD